MAVVPTGLKTLTLNDERKALIEYKCIKCGQQDLHEFTIETTQVETVHVFGGRKAEEKAKNRLLQRADEDLQKQDDKLYEEINVKRDYSGVCSPIYCPTCGVKQPWSGMPKPWNKVKRFGEWICGLIIVAMFVLFALREKALVPILITSAVLLVLILLPFINTYRRKRKLRALQGVSFQPPKYYNNSNPHEPSDSSEAQSDV